jgi:hypothetical protein
MEVMKRDREQGQVKATGGAAAMEFPKPRDIQFDDAAPAGPASFAAPAGSPLICDEFCCDWTLAPRSAPARR